MNTLFIIFAAFIVASFGDDDDLVGTTFIGDFGYYLDAGSDNYCNIYVNSYTDRAATVSIEWTTDLCSYCLEMRFREKTEIFPITDKLVEENNYNKTQVFLTMAAFFNFATQDDDDILEGANFTFVNCPKKFSSTSTSSPEISTEPFIEPSTTVESNSNFVNPSSPSSVMTTTTTNKISSTSTVNSSSAFNHYILNCFLFLCVIFMIRTAG